MRATIAPSWVLAWLLGAFSMVGATSHGNSNRLVHHTPPVFAMHELRSGSRTEELLSTLRTTGLIAVSLEDSEFNFGNAREAAYDGLCRCTEDRSGQEGTSLIEDVFTKLVESTDRVVLPDGETTRSTFATATLGRSSPLSFPESLSRVCGSDTTDAMDQLRDFTAIVSEAFISTMDRFAVPAFLHGNTTNSKLVDDPLLRNSHGGVYHSFGEIVQGATNLEHFHVYHKQQHSAVSTDRAEERLPRSLEWHSDAGLFLAFVPSLPCDDQSGDSSFWIRHKGTEQPVRFPEHSIAIMMGAGAQHWIQLDKRGEQRSPIRSSSVVRATSHAVHMAPGSRRAWYGMSKFFESMLLE
jgi:hypothetical protein